MYRYKIRYNLKETENELRENLVQLYQKLIEKNDPVFFAVESDKVVGWCDIRRKDNPRHNHRGELGMGLLKERRSRGIGSLLLREALQHAKKMELKK